MKDNMERKTPKPKSNTPAEPEPKAAPVAPKAAPVTPSAIDEDPDLARLRRQMDDDNGDAPPFWDPEPGETIIGTVIRYEDRQTKVGPCRVAVIEDVETDEPVSVWLSRMVLKNEFEKQSPRIGDTVGLKFHGERETRRGDSTYFHYTLRVVRTKAGDAYIASELRDTANGVVDVAADDDEDVPL